MIPRLTSIALAVQIRTRKNLKPDVPCVLTPWRCQKWKADPLLASGTTTTTNSRFFTSLEALERFSGTMECFPRALCLFFPLFILFLYYHESDILIWTCTGCGLHFDQFAVLSSIGVFVPSFSILSWYVRYLVIVIVWL